jgi:hypothetical protein
MSRKLALLIGNSTYGPGLPPLEKPDADIAALAKVLADPEIGGFDDVKPLLDASSATARLEVARFFFGRSPDDLLLLYFSGHGLRNDRGGLYLAVQDTEAELLSGTAVPAAFISEEMDNCRSRRQILILDCCYSGAFGPGAKGPAVNPATAFTGNGLGRFVLTASDSTQLAWEDVAANSKGGLSVFTRHLVAGLESGEADLDGDGFISVDELYDYVYARVVEENPRQTPGKSTSKQQGEIFLARNAGGARIRPLPAELMQALDHPLATVREGAVRELGRFLRGSDAGLALAARKAAEQATDDDSRRVAIAAAEILAAVAPSRAEPVPLSKPAPEPQPAPAAKIDEERPSLPITIPSAEGSHRVPNAAKKKEAIPWVTWIILGVIVVGVIFALLNSRTPKDEEPAEETPLASAETPAASAETPTQPDPARALLTEAKSWPIVLADNFDSAEASTSFLQTELSGADSAGTYTGLISSGVLRTSYVAKTKEGGFNSDFANTSAVTDFYLRVDVKNVQGGGKGYAGLVFRSTQDESSVRHYYAALIDQGNYGVYVYTNKWLYLRPLTPSPAIRSGQTNSLAVIGKGSDFILFINDQKVDQISDAAYSRGVVGLCYQADGLDQVIFDFDNFELRRRPIPQRQRD